MLVPVVTNGIPPANPHLLVALDIVEKLGKPQRPPRPPHDAAVQPNRHHLGCRGPLCVQHVKGVFKVGEEPLALERLGEAHVVAVERVGDDEEGPPEGEVPVGEVIGVAVRVVQEAAFLGHEAEGVGAGLALVDAHRARPSDALLHLDCLLDMVTLRSLIHILIVPPPVAVRGNLPTRLHHCCPRLGVPLQSKGTRIHCARHVSLREQPVEPPEASARTVLVERFHVGMPHPLVGSDTDDLAEEVLRLAVPVEHAVLRALLVVDDELHREARVPRPPGVRWSLSIPHKVPGVGGGGGADDPLGRVLLCVVDEDGRVSLRHGV
mmetsp:Transcript_16133/g.40685  ORF Transcript_16133/g.40685 Transcript_16133/m.40685 type:complete len:322 (-) Transcript_16133:24-989(-)